MNTNIWLLKCCCEIWLKLYFQSHSFEYFGSSITTNKRDTLITWNFTKCQRIISWVQRLLLNWNHSFLDQGKIILLNIKHNIFHWNTTIQITYSSIFTFSNKLTWNTHKSGNSLAIWQRQSIYEVYSLNFEAFYYRYRILHIISNTFKLLFEWIGLKLNYHSIDSLMRYNLNSLTISKFIKHLNGFSF